MTDALQEQIARLLIMRPIHRKRTEMMRVITDLERFLKEYEKRLDEEVIINQKGADREEKLLIRISKGKDYLNFALNDPIFNNITWKFCITKALAALNGE